MKEPGILFLDEPTSGLDSEMAVSLMTLLVRLARKGKTVSDWMWRAWLHGCKCVKGRWGGLGPVESDRYYVGVSKDAVGEGGCRAKHCEGWPCPRLVKRVCILRP